MQILLINTNPVVSRLFTLCLKGKPVELHEASSLDEVQNKHYDLAFFDDAAYQNLNPNDLQILPVSKRVLLSSQEAQTDEMIDDVIKKPFLPSKIIEMIESFKEDEPMAEHESIEEPEEVPHIFPLSTAKEEDEVDVDEALETQESKEGHEILDLTEIEKIKSLLEMEEEEDEELLYKDEDELESLKREVIKQNLIDEGLEIVEEADVIEAVENDLSLHITHDTQPSSKSQKEFEEKLLDAVKKMKLKKLKKLLKGAEITINIHFKDSQ